MEKAALFSLYNLVLHLFVMYCAIQTSAVYICVDREDLALVKCRLAYQAPGLESFAARRINRTTLPSSLHFVDTLTRCQDGIALLFNLFMKFEHPISGR